MENIRNGCSGLGVYVNRESWVWTSISFLSRHAFRANQKNRPYSVENESRWEFWLWWTAGGKPARRAQQIRKYQRLCVRCDAIDLDLSTLSIESNCFSFSTLWERNNRIASYGRYVRLRHTARCVKDVNALQKVHDQCSVKGVMHATADNGLMEAQIIRSIYQRIRLGLLSD